ncbi:MAG: cytochrome c peroxidase [Pseudomonadota bacterium]|nr:cytochrome c peroxidase [Pseudomonadota bacterium]MEC8291850.1 cytochrome c peroxidase [Pseudomonadota bacterium]
MAAPEVRPDFGPPPVFRAVDPARAELGHLLFYDPILSGNRNVSCATCHHPRFGTSDGLSLGLGEGGIGLGPDRKVDASNPPEQRIPRNAPALFNLGAEEFSVMFHDGRLEADSDHPDGMRTPLGQEMLSGFDSVLSAQAMFPVLSGDEMAGHYSENEVSQSVRLGHLSLPGGAWDKIAARVVAVPEYRSRFDAVLGQDAAVSFTDISDVLADFIRVEWRADDSAFDRHMRGEAPMSAAAQQGMDLFYGKAGCGSCHSGWFQTDHGFHAIAMPQIGPGKAARFETHARDEGRMRVTGAAEDAYRFRTPSLRNITDTGPYGHAGSYATLEAVVRHHLDPVAGLMGYDPAQAVLAALDGMDDQRILRDEAELAAIAEANELSPVDLSDVEVDAILSFLAALSDDGWRQGRMGVPETVPSGLPVDR